MLKISVIIPAWITSDELYELTNQTVMSLSRSKGWQRCELIIVDNGSPLGGDQLMKVSDIYIRNKENVGYPKAVNQGIALATGDYICIANNDIRVSPNWIEVTRKIYANVKMIGSIHFKMVNYNSPFNLGNAVWDKGKERWCTGSFFLFNKMALLRLQDEYGYIMDEKYGLGGYDDWDWHHRLNHQCEWKSVYTNAAAFQHKHSSTLGLDEQRINRDNKNREYFKRKFGKYPEEIWTKKYPGQMNKSYLPFP